MSEDIGVFCGLYGQFWGPIYYDYATPIGYSITAILMIPVICKFIGVYQNLKTSKAAYFFTLVFFIELD